MKLRSIMLSTGLLCAGALLGSGVRTGLADGIPAKDPLYYSGSLSEGGQLVNGQRTIGINLYTDQTTMTPFCQTVATNVEVVNGRFRVALAASCKGQINQNSSAWIEVIDGVTSVGRAKIGAVPYAVEADRASNASGLLASQITQLQGVVHSPSAFHAWVTTPVSIPGRVTFPVAFDHVEYDLAGEYNSTTGVFDPKQSGVYLVKCGFVLGPAPAAACAAVVLKNGSEVDARDVPQNLAFNVGVEVTTMLQLLPGDSVTCAAFQNLASAQSLLSSAPARNTFSVARLY
jgi:hypothetical protein